MYSKFAIFKLFWVAEVAVGNTLRLKPASYTELGNKKLFQDGTDKRITTEKVSDETKSDTESAETTIERLAVKADGCHSCDLCDSTCNSANGSTQEYTRILYILHIGFWKLHQGHCILHIASYTLHLTFPSFI